MNRHAKARRLLLLCGAMVMLVTDALWLLRSKQADPVEFKLELTQTSITRIPAHPGRIRPTFNPSNNRRLLDGRNLKSVSSFVEDADPEKLGPHSVGHLVLVNLPDEATIGTFRRALLALSSEGICRAAFLAATMSTSGDEGLVYVLTEVRSDEGQTTNCEDRFNR